jgi:hypothetical protein
MGSCFRTNLDPHLSAKCADRYGAPGWGIERVGRAGADAPCLLCVACQRPEGLCSLRFALCAKVKRSPFGKDRQKGKYKGRSRSFALLRMTIEVVLAVVPASLREVHGIWAPGRAWEVCGRTVPFNNVLPFWRDSMIPSEVDSLRQNL